MSKKYESGNNGPGTIANNAGDIGGASYGTYQIATNTGTMDSFLSWAADNAPGVGAALGGKAPGTDAFNTAWKSLAAQDAEGFNAVQHEFIKQSHYDPAVNAVAKATGLNPNERSNALQDVLWSVAVQHGPAGATRIFRAAGVTPDMTDREIIQRVYEERSANDGKKYFPSSSDAIRRSVVNRFKNELQDALNML